MKLTSVERLLLANQYAILAKLDPENAAHFERAQDVVESGYEGAYDWYSHISEEVLSESECSEVIEILTMYRVVGDTLAALPDKTDIDTEGLKFRGFDGNHDKQFGFSSFLAREGKFTESLGQSGINSHGTVLPMYRRKLEAWKLSEEPYKPSRDDIARIAKT